MYGNGVIMCIYRMGSNHQIFSDELGKAQRGGSLCNPNYCYGLDFQQDLQLQQKVLYFMLDLDV